MRHSLPPTEHITNTADSLLTHHWISSLVLAPKDVNDVAKQSGRMPESSRERLPAGGELIERIVGRVDCVHERRAESSRRAVKA